MVVTETKSGAAALAAAPSTGPPPGTKSNKKKALLIGCNYPGTKAQLNGCVNDALNMKKMLMDQYGFQEADITLMLDKIPAGVTAVHVRI